MDRIKEALTLVEDSLWYGHDNEDQKRCVALLRAESANREILDSAPMRKIIGHFNDHDWNHRMLLDCGHTVGIVSEPTEMPCLVCQRAQAEPTPARASAGE